MKDALLMLYVKTNCALKRLADRFHNDRRGAGVAEYAMIIGLAVVIGVVVLQKFWGDYATGKGISGVFHRIVTTLSDATGGSGE